MKNKFAKGLGLLVMLLLLQATLQASYYMPESSLWQGGRNYNKDNVTAYVEYAVYDTHASDYQSKLDGTKDCFPTIGTGRYIYAYEILNFDSGSGDPIVMFSLLGGDPSNADGIGSQDFGGSAIVPDNDGKSFVWNFTNGQFVAQTHSAFLVFSSDIAPKAGDIKLSTVPDDYGDEPPANNTPEPATVALLTAGAWGLLRRKKVL